MNPVRGVRQPLDALEARNVVVLGLGQFLSEVRIALPPDDERGGFDGVNGGFGFFWPKFARRNGSN
jgi:hypothetical protein